MTTLKYKTNLNCGSCVAAVRPHLDSEPTIRRWSVDTDNPDKILTVEGDDLSPARVRQHVSAAGFQVLAELNGSASDETGAAGSAPAVRSMSAGTGTESEQKSFFATYRPLLLVLAYLLGIVALVEITAGTFDWMRAMRNFMGGFFVAFSFFKLLDLRGFVDSFQTYDVLARPVRAYGYAYPFVELGLGVAYLAGLAPVATNLVTLVVMLIGLVGVSQALLQKRRIQCACLGTVFNLPMSRVTFIEDGLMAAMAATMLAALFLA